MVVEMPVGLSVAPRLLAVKGKAHLVYLLPGVLRVTHSCPQFLGRWQWWLRSSREEAPGGHILQLFMQKPTQADGKLLCPRNQAVAQVMEFMVC